MALTAPAEVPVTTGKGLRAPRPKSSAMPLRTPT